MDSMESHTAHWVDRAPVEILLNIADHLELHDRFILSHTCRAWRAVTVRNWPAELDKLDTIGQVLFFEGVVYTWPSYWVCTDCSFTHTCKTPWYKPEEKRYKYIHRVRDQSHQAPPPVPPSTYTALSDLREAHVQFALKYTRLSSRLEQWQRQYLEALMRPSPPAGTAIGLGEDPWRRLKITEGHFLLHQGSSTPCDPNAGELWPPNTELVQLLEFTFFSFNICPYIAPFANGSSLHPPVTGRKGADMLGRWLKDKPGRKLQGGCKYCFTDFEVCLADRAGDGSAMLLLRTWTDLGGEAGRIHPDRMAFDELNYLEEDYRGVMRPEEEISGSVRNMWLGK